VREQEIASGNRQAADGQTNKRWGKIKWGIGEKANRSFINFTQST